MTLKDTVYHAILDGIFKDEYKPNQILNEKELIEKFGYSKSPVREALLTLCNEGILSSIPRLGYEVVRLAREDVQQILDYRLILEGGCLSSCYESISDTQIQILIEVNHLCNRKDDDVWNHWEANTQFHLTLLSFGANQYAYQQLLKAMNTLKRAYAQFYWTTWNVVTPTKDVQHHLPIIEHLKARDIGRVLEYLREDLMDFGI